MQSLKRPGPAVQADHYLLLSILPGLIAVWIGVFVEREQVKQYLLGVPQPGPPTPLHLLVLQSQTQNYK